MTDQQLECIATQLKNIKKQCIAVPGLNIYYMISLKAKCQNMSGSLKCSYHIIFVLTVSITSAENRGIISALATFFSSCGRAPMRFRGSLRGSLLQ